ncbi:MAG TPA: PD-(D/E)XK nuclease family transposase, partial [Lamprocystis sp. (in: g-proteobacteria)]|nr:PD-(D/E)XK nuclease family transposase [Lamprocystis sp. (in: g-proteobacteria)]
YVHRFRMRDEQGRTLIDHGGICLLELGKFAAAREPAERVDTELERWLKFFTEGEGLDAEALPEWMQTEEMRQAMSTLKGFSEKEREYHAYQARQNYLRQQSSIQRRLDELEAAAIRAQAVTEQAQAAEGQARAAEEQARARETVALHREAAARAEIERLRGLLKGVPGADDGG